VDLGPIMTEITGLSIYGPGRAVTHYMPGSYRGIYWLVPGDFSTAIPPGEWRIAAHKGYEYAPLRETITITSGQHATIDLVMDRQLDMPAAGWWSGDDHVHSRLLHSEDADKLLAYVQASDIHVANVLEMGDQTRTWYSQRGFGPDFRVQRGTHVLVPGQEDPRAPFGHSIGLNITSKARFLDQYVFYDLAADEIRRQGGLYGHTHVGEVGLGVLYDMTLQVPRGKSDFASIMQNVLGTERYYPFLNLGYKLTASAGSDVPYGGVVGVTRLFAYLGEGAPFDVDAWFAAVKAGHTFVTNGPMLDLRINDAMPGDSIVLDGTPLRVIASARGIPRESAPTLVELVANGDVIATAKGSGLEEVVTLEAEVTEEHGAWIALRVTGANGSNAHTTPIYAAREGHRHWRFQDVPQLLAERRAMLAEMRGFVETAVQADAADTLSPLDLWNRALALHADGMRERFDLVSGLYDELEAQWRAERDGGRTIAP
jgi:hypothetical protein